MLSEKLPAYRELHISSSYCQFISLRYVNRPVISGFGLYDPTSIMNASELNRAQKEGWVKLAFYILLFFYYIYGYTTAVFFALCKFICDFL